MKPYTHQVLRVVAGQICKTIGWQSITSTSLEILVDILERYITEICQSAHNYSEHCNRSEANISDIELAFKDMGINMGEVMEYVTYVDPILPLLDVPKIPVAKESHLNFLKPGSKEVLTRPVHIHEHLPPINPPEDEPLYQSEKDIDVVGIPGTSGDDVFKRPDGEGAAKKIKLEDEGRATREISSVMMTTSGFISPAREGKLPESRPPKLQDEYPKVVPPPMISPPFKAKESTPLAGVGGGGGGDKKLEKKLKKQKTHEKERKKDKHFKDKMPDPSALDIFNPQSSSSLPPASMPREANEQFLMAERKKELKKLKTKTKEERKKKEKPSKAIFTPPKFDPFDVLPTSLPPPVSSQIQAHNYLTGAAHSGLFGTPNILDHNIFGSQSLTASPLLASQNNPLIDGKLVSEPDKNKLNIFKKIQRAPKEEPLKVSPQMPDFFTPSKLDPHQFQPESMQKIPKLPKDTTLTRIDEPMNLSSGQPFEQPQLPKTPTIPRTPDIKLQQNLEKKEKKERKKREKQIQQQQMDWASQASPFENNPFLQSLQNAGLMNPFLNAARNPFDIFPSGPGLIPQFGMNQSLLNPYGNSPQTFSAPNLPSHSPVSKKVKQSAQNEFMGSKFCNIPSLLPAATTSKERSFHDRPQSHLNIAEPPNLLPLQQQISSTFDQLLKDQMQQQAQVNLTSAVTPAKRLLEKEMETFDLTKDSSPEPTMAVPDVISTVPSTLPDVAPFIQQPQQLQLPVEVPTAVPVLKEKSKEKKKKKDKDKEERKKKKKEKKKKKDKHKEKHRASMSTLDSQSNDTEDTADNGSTSSMPKITLKLNSPRPNTPDNKKLLLHRVRNDDFEFSSPHQETSHIRDPSPELVRISPLVTRPPKQKSSTSIYPTSGHTGFISPPQNYHESPQQYHQSSYQATQYQQSYYEQPHYHQNYSMENQNTYQDYTSYQHQLEQQNYYQQPPVASHSYQMPIQQPQQVYQAPQQQQPPSHHQQTSQTWNISQSKSSYIDANGSTVWICPACGSIDDGSPMIGCDSCDAWYHWACVGIIVEPKDDEDWFCRACISRKQNEGLEGKKKKRKKKDREKREVH